MTVTLALQSLHHTPGLGSSVVGNCCCLLLKTQLRVKNKYDSTASYIFGTFGTLTDKKKNRLKREIQSPIADETDFSPYEYVGMV